MLGAVLNVSDSFLYSVVVLDVGCGYGYDNGDGSGDGSCDIDDGDGEGDGNNYADGGGYGDGHYDGESSTDVAMCRMSISLLFLQQQVLQQPRSES